MTLSPAAKVVISMLLILALAGCVDLPSSQTVAEQGLNSAIAHATNTALESRDSSSATAQAKQQRDQDNASATLAAYNATTQAVNATRIANDATIAALSVEQQSNAATTQAKQNESAIAISINAATATARAVDQMARIDADTATKQAAESQATLTAVTLAEQKEIGTRGWKNDFWYLLPDLLMQYAPCGFVIIAMLLLWFMGRAIASRIAGDEGRAKMALANPGITLYLPTALLPAPRYEDQGNTEETGNGETEETLGNSTVSRENSTEMAFTNLGETGTLERMTHEEYDELQLVRHDALELLTRCVDHYRKTSKPDDGIIPRYDKIGMKAELRGKIVDDLVYSGIASVVTNKKTFVVPEIGSCSKALYLIVKNQRRVYPAGYSERKQQRLDDAVNAVPLSAAR